MLFLSFIKRAVDESTAAAESRAAVALEAALSQAKEQALEEKIAAVEAIVEKARKEAEAEMKKASDAHVCRRSGRASSSSRYAWLLVILLMAVCACLMVVSGVHSTGDGEAAGRGDL